MNIKDAVIIFDEAHNVENVAEECCSKELLIKDKDWDLFNHNEIIEDKNLEKSIKKLQKIKEYYFKDKKANNAYIGFDWVKELIDLRS